MPGSETLHDCLRCNRLVTYKGTLIGRLPWVCAYVMSVLYPKDPKGDIVMEKAIVCARQSRRKKPQNFCLLPSNFAISCKTFSLPQETLCLHTKLLPSPKKLYINLQNLKEPQETLRFSSFQNL